MSNGQIRMGAEKTCWTGRPSGEEPSMKRGQQVCWCPHRNRASHPLCPFLHGYCVGFEACQLPCPCQVSGPDIIDFKNRHGKGP